MLRARIQHGTGAHVVPGRATPASSQARPHLVQRGDRFVQRVGESSGVVVLERSASPGTHGLTLTSQRASRGPDAVSTTLRGVRLVIARCSVDYIGRLTAHLPLATRLLMVKADGSVSVHADDRAYKPLNWMSPPCRIEEAPGVWRVVNRAGEELRITLEEVFQDTSYELGLDPGLRKDGVEAHLQELLAAMPGVLGDGFTLVRREYPTAIGPVDLLCRDGTGATVAVDVKRRGEIDGVEQLTR